MAGPGRNDPCPCGSGKKYKRCCLPAEATARPAPAPAGPTVEERLEDLLHRVLAFGQSPEQAVRLRAARELFFGPAAVEDYPTEDQELLLGLFDTWYVFAHRDEGGQTLVERFLAERPGRRLPPEDRALLEGLGHERYRLALVGGVEDQLRVTLVDAHTRERLVFDDRALGRIVTRGDMLLFLPFRLPHATAVRSVLALEPGCVAFVLGSLQKFVDTQAGQATVARLTSVVELLERAPHLAFHVVLDALVAFRRPELVTTDGEALVFCRARFRVRKPLELQLALVRHRSFEPDDAGGFTWLTGKKRKGQQAGRQIALGRVSWDGEHAVLETQSRERLEKGKALLASFRAAGLEHVADEQVEPRELLGKALGEPGAGGGRPLEVAEVVVEAEQQALASFMERHYASWPDTPLPALAGRTPRQAAAEPAIRPLVIALIESMESRPDWDERAGRYDFGKLRRALGIRADE